MNDLVLLYADGVPGNGSGSMVLAGLNPIVGLYRVMMSWSTEARENPVSVGRGGCTSRTFRCSNFVP